jgi:hypothetical protein
MCFSFGIDVEVCFPKPAVSFIKTIGKDIPTHLKVFVDEELIPDWMKLKDLLNQRRVNLLLLCMNIVGELWLFFTLYFAVLHT